MTTIAPGCSAFQPRSGSAVIESARLQPASRSGIRTFLSGERIEAVSAMKWTPQNTITSGSVVAGEREVPRRCPRRAGEGGVRLHRERADLLAERSDLRRSEFRGNSGLDRRELLHEPFLS